MAKNMKRRIIVLLIALVFVSAGIWFVYVRDNGQQVARAQLRIEPPDNTDAFARASEPQPFEFPRDHGPHPEYQTEWWYYTGNLEAADGRQFGFQLTFFRRGLVPGTAQRPSDWAANQVYFAHFTTTDVANQNFVEAERFSRGGAGIAGAQAQPYRVWLDDWSAEVIDGPHTRDSGVVRLRAVNDTYSLDITVEPAKPAVANGENGLSQKSEEPGNASYYYSFTRLIADGTITRGDTEVPVEGTVWMDHEYSTQAIGSNIRGWDWFSLQLSDGWDLMYYGLRNEDGSVDPVSEGTLVAPDGTAQRISLDEIEVEVLDRWTSPESGAEYPAEWRLRIPSEDIDLIIKPMIADQELNVSFTYWEGAVRVAGTHAGTDITGEGYVELTGYAHTMQDRF